LSSHPVIPNVNNVLANAQTKNTTLQTDSIPIAHVLKHSRDKTADNISNKTSGLPQQKLQYKKCCNITFLLNLKLDKNKFLLSFLQILP
jgi:hypothetical protein